MFQPAQALTFDTANAVLEAGMHAIAGGQTQVDLSHLTAVDSAALATLLAWKREANQRGAALEFINFPPSLHSLAEVYGVADLLQH